MIEAHRLYSNTSPDCFPRFCVFKISLQPYYLSGWSIWSVLEGENSWRSYDVISAIRMLWSV